MRTPYSGDHSRDTRSVARRQTCLQRGPGVMLSRGTAGLLPPRCPHSSNQNVVPADAVFAFVQTPVGCQVVYSLADPLRPVPAHALFRNPFVVARGQVRVISIRQRFKRLTELETRETAGSPGQFSEQALSRLGRPFVRRPPFRSRDQNRPEHTVARLYRPQFWKGIEQE